MNLMLHSCNSDRKASPRSVRRPLSAPDPGSGAADAMVAGWIAKQVL
ncbi:MULTISPECIES: hypothetical protein [Rhodopseudomonas]|nr:MULTISPECIES: hypothetical protein [Rhodopseudomonas]